MLLDPRTLRPGSTVEADICIIGAGPAGIAFAREFIGGSLKVCMLESGGSDHEPDLADLYSADSVGLPTAPLASTRGWGFGGTSATWDTEIGPGGPGWRSRPLDSWDLEVRDWITYSGWPFDFATLLPYYRRAQDVCGLGPFPYEDRHFPRHETLRTWHAFRPVVFQFGQSRLFWDVYREEISNSPNVHVYLGVVANKFATTQSGDRVIRITGNVVGGGTMDVAAQLFVLAAGGIENARLLLLSDNTLSSGLGNEHGLVGRFFMEHPHVRMGIVTPADTQVSRFPTQMMERVGDVLTEVWLGPPQEVLAGNHLPNFAFTFSSIAATAETRYITFQRPLSPGSQSLRRLWRAARRGRLVERPLAELASVFGDLPTVSAAVLARLRWRIHETRRFKHVTSMSANGERVLAINAMIEQVPNPDSRVMLTSQVNRLGMRRAALDWKLRPEDVRALMAIQSLLQEEAQRLRLGRIYVVTDSDRYKQGRFNGGHHHMGTTRMHADPRHGVVDPNCRVHSLSNLYVSGSSVFPTTGFANPTLTVVALALRLADHLKERMRADHR